MLDKIRRILRRADFKIIKVDKFYYYFSKNLPIFLYFSYL